MAAAAGRLACIEQLSGQSNLVAARGQQLVRHRPRLVQEPARGSLRANLLLDRIGFAESLEPAVVHRLERLYRLDHLRQRRGGVDAYRSRATLTLTLKAPCGKQPLPMHPTKRAFLPFGDGECNTQRPCRRFSSETAM